MICAPCARALTTERIANDPDETAELRKLMRDASWRHMNCLGNCDCLHEGYEFNNPSVLYHGGVGGFKPGAILTPPAVSGYLRPQECIRQVNLKNRNDWLMWKRTYRPDRMYCTTAIHLARDHAAGWSNWAAVTNAGEAYAPQGAVYRVEPIGILSPDLGIAHEHCCKREHDDIDWCAFSASRLLVTEVVEPAVEAAKWPIYLGRLSEAYEVWRRKNGGVHWWQQNQPEVQPAEVPAVAQESKRLTIQSVKVRMFG